MTTFFILTAMAGFLAAATLTAAWSLPVWA